jgi:deoxyribodipyrimidine photo-lyase
MNEPELRREFSDRDDRAAHLRATFPDAAARDPRVSPILGGRRAAEARLARIEPGAYARSRNFLDGSVTRLSPYLRHGVLGLAEARDAVFAAARTPDEARKLVTEMAWRDYFRRVYAVIGEGVRDDREPIRTGVPAAAFAAEVPEDVREARTGNACIDGLVRELHETGYLHNHARMWLASYVVHFRRVRWRAGADWFLTHLLDGDPSSNHLSWQWVASTFSNKPYIFNRENLERFTGGVYCDDCPVRGRCEFDATYETLAARLFAVNPASLSTAASSRLAGPAGPDRPVAAPPAVPSVVWAHHDDLNPRGPALAAAGPGVPAVWAWDARWLNRDAIGLKRLMFVSECLAEMPVSEHQGDAETIVAEFAARHEARQVLATASPDPWVQRVFAGLRRRGLAVEEIEPAPFVTLDRPPDLTRFSRYWNRAEKRLF